MKASYLVVSCCLILLGASPPTTTAPDLPRVPPTEPGKAVATFKCLDGFHMDLLAAEPLVTDPVAMCYDEDGRAYVAEMNDYPYTDPKTHQAFKENPNDKPIGKIRLLVDTDGDGVFDKSTVFAEGLSWPTGVACYKGGVFVCATPDVWYFKDTDGDGKADVKRKVFTGFRKFNVQAVMNNLAWGLDNKLYGAGGSNGGKIAAVDKSDAQPLTLARNDFRFDPRTESIELIPGGARFGNAFDDWGNRFVCNIRNPAQHVVIEDSNYLTRNPFAIIPSVVHDVAESGDALPVYRISPPEAWRDFRAKRFSAEGAKQPRSELVAAGVVTSSSGITVYRGDAYPPEFRRQFFIGEVANNLIHRQVMRDDGVTFSSKRVDEQVDFVASTDVWFRPVNFVNAPDGTLHVLDMYREVIEHPWSIPDDIREKLDLRSGADRGRIYRLAPPGFKTPKPPHLSTASTAELVKCLENRNSWWRETAERLLIERQDKSAAEPLRDMVRESREPLARLHALWTLDGLSSLDAPTVLRGLKDPSPGVRENAIRIAERHSHQWPRMNQRLVELARDDGDPRVRFQATLALGEAHVSVAGDDTDESEVVRLLAGSVSREPKDAWLMAAVLSGMTGDRATGVLHHLLHTSEPLDTPAEREAIRQIAAIEGAQAKSFGAIDLIGEPGMPLAVRFETGVGLGEGLRRAHRTLHQAVHGNTVDQLMIDAARVAADASADMKLRGIAIRLLGFDDLNRTRDALGGLLDAKQPPEIQRAAVVALASNNAPEVGPMLMSRWRSYTPAVRADVVQAMLAFASRIPVLLDGLESGRVALLDVPLNRRQALMQHVDARIRDRATKLFTASAPAGNRSDVVAGYAQALQLTGNASEGKKIFETTCATCHKVNDIGNNVGPNLATVRQWTGEQLITNILDPNREVAPAFVEYIVQLKSGETLSGIVEEETGTSLTLKMPGGAQRVLSRQSVKRIAGSGVSLMPEGLEAQMSTRQMADLIAFLRGAPNP